MIKIKLNDRLITLNAPIVLNTLLTEHYSIQSGMAIAVNQTIIPRRKWMEYQVHDGDEIVLFQAIAGG